MTTLSGALGDVDGDGALDLVLTNAGGPTHLLHNDGSGHFTDITATHLPAQTAVTVGVQFGDVNGDGALDLVLANRDGPPGLWLNDGQGHFTDATAGHLPAQTARTMAVVLGDVDGNGTLDLVLVNQGTPSQLLLNNGLGVFTDVTATHLPGYVSPSTEGLLVDVDGDGALDLVLAAGEAGVRLWLNDGHGQFREVTEDHVPLLDVFAIKVAAGDVDGDGAVDLVVAAAGQAQLLRNDGTGRFQRVTASWLPADPRRSFGVALVDVDHTLAFDLLLATSQGPVRLLLNDTTAPQVRLTVLSNVLAVGRPVALMVEAFATRGLATATLTVTDPSGATQRTDCTHLTW